MNHSLAHDPRTATARRIGLALVSLLALLGLSSPGGAASPEVTIVCIGDSLTEGFGVEPEQAFPVLLEARLHELGHRHVRVVNAGISGSTSASGVSRLRWQLRARPSIVILALGANDGLRGVDLASTRANLTKTIALARENSVRVVLAGMQIPPNYGLSYTREFSSLFVELADEYDVGLIPFLLEGVAADPALNLPDGIHPNPEGYVRVAENVLRVVLPLL